ncbi:unnamed protein product, partial [Staurois parvus]
WGPRAIGDHGAPVSLPTLKKAYKKGTRGTSWGPLLIPGPRANSSQQHQTQKQVEITKVVKYRQGRIDNSWGPRQYGVMGTLCPCPHSNHTQKSLLKVPGTSHGAPY